jgi:photosystem II stability/assembly factor-like uncharacterized protein
MTRTYFTVVLLIVGTCLYAQDWEFTGGPGGDILTSMTVAPNGDLFVLSQGLHRSTDKGQTWQRLAHELTLALTTNAGNNVTSKIASQSNGFLFLGTPQGVWKSSDNGNSWVNVLTQPVRIGVDIAVSDQGTIIYINDSVRISSDGGTSWRVSKTVTGRKVYLDSSGNFFVGGSYSSYRSTNQGASWARLINGFPANASLEDLKPLSKDRVLAVVAQAAYLSTDHGRTWTKQGAHTSTYASIAVVGGAVLLLTDQRVILRSTDEGTTWNGFDTLEKASFYRILNLCYHDSNLYIMSMSQLWRRSLAIPAWDIITIPNGGVSKLLAHPSGQLFAATTQVQSELYYYGKLWSFLDTGWSESFALYSATSVSMRINAFALDSAGGLLLAGNSILTSSDLGLTWSAIPSIYSHIIETNKEGMIFIAADGVYRTTDQGVTWDQFNEGISNLQITSISTSDDGVVFAAEPQSFYRSTNYGFTWQEMPLPFILGTQNVRAITHVGNNVIVGADKTGVYFSSDNGVMWENHSTGLPLDTINQLLMTPSGPIFAATSTGIYEYVASTQTWRSVSGNGLAGNILSLALSADGKVYAGTAGGGVYRSTKTYGSWFKSSVTSKTYLPDNMSVFPNPASSEITISFKDPQTYRASIYNLLGEAFPVEPRESAGELTIDVHALANGHYFLRLFQSDKTQTLPFIIQR